MIKVLGIGSPFAEDRVGWLVAEALKKQLGEEGRLNQYLQIESVDRPGLRLIELMRGFTTVFLIDAVHSGQEVGLIHRLQADELQSDNLRFSTHHLGVLEALQLGNALHCLPKEIVLYGIETDRFDIDAVISESVLNAVHEVVLRIKHELVSQ